MAAATPGRFATDSSPIEHERRSTTQPVRAPASERSAAAFTGQQRLQHRRAAPVEDVCALLLPAANSRSRQQGDEKIDHMARDRDESGIADRLAYRRWKLNACIKTPVKLSSTTPGKADESFAMCSPGSRSRRALRVPPYR